MRTVRPGGSWTEKPVSNGTYVEYPEATKKVLQHEILCKEINAMYAIKNQAYGDSFSKSYTEYGMTMPAIRLEDKLNRFKRLASKEAQPNDESMRDTLLDLANYALMTVMELDSDGSKQG